MKSRQLIIAAMVSVFSIGIYQPVLFQDKPVQTWSAKSQSTDYRIGAGDVIEVATWKEPDLSRKEVLVRVDGKISFPLIGDIPAAGMTPAEVTETIQKGLTNYVTAPVVTVTVTSPGSQKVYVLGEVMKTGEYPILKNLTVLLGGENHIQSLAIDWPSGLRQVLENVGVDRVLEIREGAQPTSRSDLSVSPARPPRAR